MKDKQTKIIIAGFGGQGIVMAGSIIARAAVYQGLNVTAIVSYGAEMRGGTANSTVVISQNEIASPVVETPDIAIILNRPSLDKFEPRIAESGLVILNSSLIDREVQRDDLSVVKVDATETAKKLGNIRVANIIALGAFTEAAKIIKQENIEKAIKETFSGPKESLAAINIEALRYGAETVK